MAALPLFTEAVRAGFPSPAQGYMEEPLDLNKLCIRQEAATFLLRVEGDSMIEAGIYAGDILVVDRSLQAVHGDIVVAAVGGEFTVKELSLKPSPRLLPRNPDYAPIVLEEGGWELFGVVTFALHTLRGTAGA
ncbi:translesion error-prone DNA polymerase V autoproteolytic subunit [Alcanivorax sp. S6407]|uniref:translesion error-prone DNA polymerase V autoproteolytic subunit n=1 Tax=Alcanivorax sp. S6407 TaxID=2926424 RepID=UPI001FF38EF9|nr:translesion error-prone DNA polymerase V autoproteolytic subunit [Alcanivorax sp. S6407]MCK0152168.1 translesion error-prone DNA polymerase V autoproteolytic subunit [Alcanivorax sp. S6407]